MRLCAEWFKRKKKKTLNSKNLLTLWQCWVERWKKNLLLKTIGCTYIHTHTLPHTYICLFPNCKFFLVAARHRVATEWKAFCQLVFDLKIWVWSESLKSRLLEKQLIEQERTNQRVRSLYIWFISYIYLFCKLPRGTSNLELLFSPLKGRK